MRLDGEEVIGGVYNYLNRLVLTIYLCTEAKILPFVSESSEGLPNRNNFTVGIAIGLISSNMTVRISLYKGQVRKKW